MRLLKADEKKLKSPKLAAIFSEKLTGTDTDTLKIVTMPETRTIH